MCNILEGPLHPVCLSLSLSIHVSVFLSYLTLCFCVSQPLWLLSPLPCPTGTHTQLLWLSTSSPTALQIGRRTIPQIPPCSYNAASVHPLLSSAPSQLLVRTEVGGRGGGNERPVGASGQLEATQSPAHGKQRLCGSSFSPVPLWQLPLPRSR